MTLSEQTRPAQPPVLYGVSARITTQTSYLNWQRAALPPVHARGGRHREAVARGRLRGYRLGHPPPRHLHHPWRAHEVRRGRHVHAEGVSELNGTHITAFVNLPTVNYIMIGLQRRATAKGPISSISRRQGVCGPTPKISEQQGLARSKAA
eukprot:768638-Hanusia_phi.AAC.3